MLGGTVSETKNIMLIFTVKIFRASVKSFFIFFAFLCRCFLIAECCSEDARAVFNQKFHHCQIIARSGTMKRSPTSATIQIFNTQKWLSIRLNT